MKIRTISRALAAGAALFALGGGAKAQTFTPSVLLNFGQIPRVIGQGSALVEGHDGYFYGVFPQGGTVNQGIVYKISPTGTVRVYSFGINSPMTQPYTLIRALDGNIYGLTHNGDGPNEAGCLFRLTADGVISTFYTFQHAVLATNLVQGSDGKLYGLGIFSDGGSTYYQTLYSLTMSGVFSEVRLSTNMFGTASLVDGQDGFFYGIDGNGMLFRLSLNGVVSPLHQFTQGAPFSPLTLGADGYLYGTVSNLGNPSLYGDIYRISRAGAYSVIASLPSGGPTYPEGQIVQDVNGGFLTTTRNDLTSGGTNMGAVIGFNTAGSVNTILNLNSTYGAYPVAGATLSHIGDLYVVTTAQGTSNNGTILKFTRSAGGSATHFRVHPLPNYPDSIPAGSKVTFEVTALDSSNNNAQTYNGTVHFSSSDHAGVMPGNIKLTKGYGVYSATLNTVGNQTITATDTVNGGITGTSSGIDVPGPATHLVLTPPASPVAGQVGVTITALDGANDRATGYTGTVQFSSSNAKDVMPANSAVINGAAGFNFMMTSVGTRTVTVTDVANPSLHTSVQVTVNPGPMTGFNVGSTVSWVNAGTPVSVHVVARDQYNNTVTSYSGTVIFRCTDTAAVLPSGTLTNGAGFFNVTFNTPGTQNLVALDSVNTSLNGSKRFGVNP